MPPSSMSRMEQRPPGISCSSARANSSRVSPSGAPDASSSRMRVWRDGSSRVRCDVTVARDVENAVKATVDAFGGIDTVVNNAGIAVIASLVNLTEEDLDRIIAINLKGVFFGIKYGAPAIIASGGGSIVNVAS